MKASEWRQTLGSMATTAQDAIVAALTDPNMLVPIEWVGIPISGGGHDAILYVGCDSLKVGEPDDCVRVNVSMSAHQQVCDALGLQMPTAKMLDVIYANREVTAEPCTYQIGANGNITVIDPATGAQTIVSMSSVTAMFAHDARVSNLVAGRRGLVCNSGKAWTLKASLSGSTAANYGWYTNAAPYKSVTGAYKLWQPLSTAHNVSHADYSQVCYAIHPFMIVDGSTVATADVITNADLAPLVSHEGALPSARHPGLGFYTPPQGVVQIAPPIESIRLVGQYGPGVGSAGGKVLALGAGLFAGWQIARHIFGV